MATNLVISKLLASGYRVQEYPLAGTNPLFWTTQQSGAVILAKENRGTAVITYGDTVESLTAVFDNGEILGCETIICCAHAARGRSVFEFFHTHISTLDFSAVNIVPIYKNLLCGYGNEALENDYTADLLIRLIE
jgi:hypothetical protein